MHLSSLLLMEIWVVLSFPFFFSFFFAFESHAAKNPFVHVFWGMCASTLLQAVVLKTSACFYGKYRLMFSLLSWNEFLRYILPISIYFYIYYNIIYNIMYIPVYYNIYYIYNIIVGIIYYTYLWISRNQSNFLAVV